ncbi:hypothetical protein [Neobacillus sp. D3-1R]|uniref:hypothetical protein n=1 Tax=Neobacillus sp. D3-1R TaxID=3445778 RepID=UPI003FA04B6C
MNNEFKELKKELNNIFDSHPYTSRKQEILKSVLKKEKHPFFSYKAYKPIINSLLTFSLLIGFAYFSYNNVFNGYSNGGVQISETVSMKEIQSSVESKWSEPFEQFQTLRGSYTFTDHIAKHTENVTYAISNENNTIRILNSNNNITSIIENQKINTIFHDQKYYQKLSIVEPPDIYLKKYRNNPILAVYPTHFHYSLFSDDFIWTQMEEARYQGFNVYKINAKREKGNGDIDNYHFILEKQTGFLLELKGYSKDRNMLLQYKTQELAINPKLTPEIFSPSLAGYKDIEEYIKGLPEYQNRDSNQ